MIRAAGSVLFTAWMTLCLLVTMPAASVVVFLVPAGPRVDRLVRWWSRLIVRLSGCPLKVTGQSHLCAPSVFVANHPSYLDSIVMMAALSMDFRFVAQQEALSWPIVGRALEKAGHIIVDRASARSRRTCFLSMKETLRSGRSVLVFPEGARSREALLPFRAGAFRAAAETACPVVPIAISGTRTILPRGFRLLRFAAITVTIHRPRDADGLDRAAAGRLRDEVARTIAASLSH